MSPELDAALARLGDVLRDEAPYDVGGCTYCYSAADLEVLGGPPGLVTDHLVSAVAFEVPDHWGDFPRTYRRHTARIMAAACAGTLHVDAGAVGARLVEAGAWRTWAPAESDALLDVVEAWWPLVLTSPPTDTPVVEVVDLLVVTPVPLSTWWAVWHDQPPGPADDHLVQLARTWLPDLSAGAVTAGWEDDVDVTTEAMALLVGSRERLGRAAGGADLDRQLGWLLH